MKKIIAIAMTLVCLLGLAGCNKTDNLTPTGYPSGQVQRQQVMYHGVIYYYTANGFDNPLPEGYALVGEVKEVDNGKEPSVDWCGSRVDVGQEIYASENSSSIYLKYESGYAEFEAKDTSQ